MAVLGPPGVSGPRVHRGWYVAPNVGSSPLVLRSRPSVLSVGQNRGEISILIQKDSTDSIDWWIINF